MISGNIAVVADNPDAFLRELQKKADGKQRPRGAGSPAARWGSARRDAGAEIALGNAMDASPSWIDIQDELGVRVSGWRVNRGR